MDNMVLLLESPLYDVSYNLWAVVALLTAALSFWKITSIKSNHPPQPFMELLEHKAMSLPMPMPMPMPASDIPMVDNVAVTRGRFSKFAMTYCYQEDDVMEVDMDDESVTAAAWNWERMRKGEMEWYKCQDFGMLNGAVVRLWDCTSTS